jgi:hypothetical protein
VTVSGEACGAWTAINRSRDRAVRHSAVETEQKARYAGLSCADEDSNLHPVIPDQALKPIVGVCALSIGSAASFVSRGLDASNVPDGVEVVIDVVTRRSPLTVRRRLRIP